MIRSRNVSRFWRTASLGLAAACVVLAWATFEMYKRFGDIGVKVGTDVFTQAMVEKFGGAYVRDVLFNRDTRRVVFTPAAAGTKSQVAAFFSPDWKEAKLFHFGLGDAEARTYKLALIDDHNNITVLKTFNPTGDMDGITFVQVAFENFLRQRVFEETLD